VSSANPPPLKTRKLGRTGVSVTELTREKLIGADAPMPE
jgi:hypothetical protein